MPAIEPQDANYEELLRKVASMVGERARDTDEIRQMSAVSFRLWLEQVVQRASKELGIAAAKAKAFVEDLFAIMGNAASTFRDAFREAYEGARQIPRRQ